MLIFNYVKWIANHLNYVLLLFQPIVGKSPLDASPIKTRLHQEGSGEEHEKDLEDGESVSGSVVF